MDWLWPIRTGKTLFDVWTIVHVCFWVYAGSFVWSFKVDRWYGMAGCLLFALLWEFFERFMEPRHLNIWLNPETWVNAYVGDMVACIIGCLFIWFALDNWR